MNAHIIYFLGGFLFHLDQLKSQKKHEIRKIYF